MNKIKSLVTSKVAIVSVAAVALAGSAMATPPDPLDFTGPLGAFKDDLGGFFATNGAIFLGALMIPLAFGIVWKLIKRGAKSV